jgi:hypothetical protein
MGGKGHKVVLRSADPRRHSLGRGEEQAGVAGDIKPGRPVGIDGEAVDVIQAIERHGLGLGRTAERCQAESQEVQPGSRYRQSLFFHRVSLEVT